VYEASVISEAFWLREFGALHSPAHDMIRLSEVITSERFGPVNPKYRGFAEHIHKCALHFVEIIVQQLDYTNNSNSQDDLKRIPNYLSPLCDLRSALNGMLGFPDIIMKELFGPIEDGYRSSAEKLHASSVSMLHTTSDMIALAHLETGSLDLDERRVDVAKAVQDALRITKPTASQRGVTLTSVLSTTNLPNLYCDQRCLPQMLVNLLSSAAKFDRAGDLVEVGTDLSDGFSIVIRDTGWGIQIDNLRLQVTKGLIERHGGNLSIMSPPNDGITVRLSFPSERILQESDGSATT
jgi:K+-sensing histidine kinase KdpD